MPNPTSSARVPSVRTTTSSKSLLAALSLISALAGCAADPDGVAGANSPVIYGADDRTDVYAHPDATLRQLTNDAIVALMRPSALGLNPGDEYTIDAFTLGVSQGLCDGQRFIEQPTAAFCSGTLVGPDLVITAGHCIENASDCANTRFVFDYYYSAEDVLESIGTDDVYSCDTLEAQRLDGTDDYAVVRLDRPVVGRVPATMRLTNDLSVGDGVTVIGFGSGIPAKIDDGGTIAENGQTGSFVASTDTFGGNSGSGVFDDNGDMIGILVRGATDYVQNGSCAVVNELSNSEADEDISRVTRAMGEYCTGRTDTICAGAPPGPEPEPMGEVCTNTCRFADDGDCDDGGPNSDFDLCDYGTDCGDCGARVERGGCTMGAPGQHPGTLAVTFLLLGLVFVRRSRR